jgi:CheY-like chemotaxis protein
LYEKRGNTSIDQYLNSKILIAVSSTDERERIEEKLKGYGYSKNDYSIASETSVAKKMLHGAQVVITNDPAVAMYANGSQLIRTDIRDEVKEERKLEEKFSSVLEGKVEQYSIRGNLLMISDDVSTLDTYQEELWELGYRTRTIVDKGDGGIREESIRYLASAKNTDAIVMDCEDEMDTSSGLMLLLILRGDFPNIPIIGRYNNKRVKEAAIRYGANSGILKSATGLELYNMIEGLLHPKEEPKVEGNILKQLEAKLEKTKRRRLISIK